jgi:hypothetical protein
VDPGQQVAVTNNEKQNTNLYAGHGPEAGIEGHEFVLHPAATVLMR